MFSAAAAVAVPEVDYASLRADVVKAYAQQAAEMTQSLSVLQALSADTAAVLTRLRESLRLALKHLVAVHRSCLWQIRGGPSCRKARRA